MNEKNTGNAMGFTLLEILVAMAILATILSTIYASFSDTFRNINYAESQAEIYQMARIALERIHEDLECTVIFEDENPPGDQETGQAPKGFFGKNETIDEKNADILTFLSSKHLSLDENDEYSGLTWVSFYVQENDEEKGLVLYRSDTPESEEMPEPKTEGLILCDNLASVNFTYFDASQEAYDNWDSSDEKFKGKPPAMVSIQLEFLNESDSEETLKFETGVSLPIARAESENKGP